jgi:hypothetical protein
MQTNLFSSQWQITVHLGIEPLAPPIAALFEW